MPQMLSIGSVGSLVIELQQKLNLLLSKLVRLVADGAFRPKTKARVMEFQGQNNLSQDGIVGPLTWQQLIQLVAQVSGNFQNNLGRMAVVGVAKTEAGLGGVYAKQSGAPTRRIRRSSSARATCGCSSTSGSRPRRPGRPTRAS